MSGKFRPGIAEMIEHQPAHEHAAATNQWLEDTVSTLAAGLTSYGMKAECIGARLTPNAALIRFRGNDQMTVDRVERRISTLYTSWGVEIISVRPGRGQIVFMVAREDRVILPTLDIWSRRQLPESAPIENTSFVIGEREDNGELLYLNVAKPFGGQPVSGPHTLIAGETGGGKGVLTSNIMLDICSTNSPEYARMVVIDPKAGVDYSWIEQTPHLEGGIVTEMGASLTTYGRLVDEMNRRYEEVLAPRRVQNIDVYNQTRGNDPVMPRIYVFHDELADWMTDDEYRKNATEYLTRLSVKGRAAGIHLFLVTQRPDKKAMPGAIKANISNKICLRVSNKVNSNIIIDESGAEALLGQGHMLALIGGLAGGPVFAQAPFLDPGEATVMAMAVGNEDKPSESLLGLQQQDGLAAYLGRADNDDDVADQRIAV